MKATLLSTLFSAAALLPLVALAQTVDTPSGDSPTGLWMDPAHGQGAPPAGTPSVTPEGDHMGLWMAPNSNLGTPPVSVPSVVPAGADQRGLWMAPERGQGTPPAGTPSIAPEGNHRGLWMEAPDAARQPTVFTQPLPVMNTIVAAPTPPPAQLHETPPPRPDDDRAQWVGGYWRWNRTNYQWIAGRWQRPPALGMTWQPPRWLHRRTGWIMDGGTWRTVVALRAPRPHVHHHPDTQH